MSARVTGLVGWFDVATDWPICSKLTRGKCPVTQGGRYTYSETELIESLGQFDDPLKNVVEIRVTDEKGKTHACIEIVHKFHVHWV